MWTAIFTLLSLAFCAGIAALAAARRSRKRAELERQKANLRKLDWVIEKYTLLVGSANHLLQELVADRERMAQEIRKESK